MIENPERNSKKNVYQFRNNGSSDLDSNQASIGHSGNSDVDVHVNIEVDTRPIAYAVLCSLLATKQLSQIEFETAVKKLEELTGGSKKRKNINDHSNPREQVRKKGASQLRLFGPNVF
ncbi:Uncharacterised protein [Mycobacteroides abscessus subsp. abscessus]|nr:Uncharacterised protein [Mycobacteroides abscessus subsp. abscessus]